MQRSILVLGAMALVCIAGCRESVPQAEMTSPAPPVGSQDAREGAISYDRADAVRRELQALMERPVSAVAGAPFLIINVNGTDKFVQFAGGAGEDLVLDLPRVVLSDDEFERAERLLADHGVAMSGEAEVPALAANFGSDIDDAVEAVGVILLQVFELDAGVALDFEAM